ncbi:MAG: hypothetical protein AMXMBFR8_19510 [Nevskiales bacterium]
MVGTMKLGNDPPEDLVLTPLERAVLGELVASLGASAADFRAQCDHARVLVRSHSGVGFVTRMRVPEEARPLGSEYANRSFAVHATHPQLREAAEFLVQFKAGRLATIEAYCGEGMWPDDDAGFRVGLKPEG